MKLSAGMPAPAFEAQDIFGTPLSLTGFSGKGLLLSFFRNGACAICNLQVHHLIEKYPDYQRRGMEIVAVFESPKESVIQHVSKQNAPFPIIADPDATLYELYGVETNQEKVLAPVDETWRNGLIQEAASIGYPLTPEQGSNFFRLPADFLIAPNGFIRSAHYSQVVGEHISFDEIEQFLGEWVYG